MNSMFISTCFRDTLMINTMTNSISLDVLSTDNNNNSCERRDAAANRQLLLETAVRLFDEHGVHNVNMADIAKEAGVGKGTLYRRFSNKGDLCLQLLDKQLQNFQDGVLLHLRQMTVDGHPYMEQLDYVLDLLVAFVSDNLPLMVEIESAPPVDDMVHPDINVPHFWQEMTVRALLERAAAADELPSDLDIYYVASAIMAALNARVIRYQLEVQGFTVQRISAGLRAIVGCLN